MAASVAVGPTTATVGSEVQLGSTISTFGTYQIYIDLINFIAGDIVEFRVYDKIPVATGIERLAQGPVSYGPIVPEEKHYASIPMITGYFKVTVKQLTGTARSVVWEIRSA